MNQKTSILKSLLKGPKTREELRQDLNTEKVANFSKKLKELIGDKIVEEFPGVKETPKKKVGRPKKGSRKGKKTGPAPKNLRIREDIETVKKIDNDHPELLPELQKNPLVIDLLLKHSTLLIQTDVIKKFPKSSFDIFDGLSSRKRTTARKGPSKNIIKKTRLDERINHFHIEFLKKCLKISPAFFKHVIRQGAGDALALSQLSMAWGIFKHCVEEDRLEGCETKEGVEMFDCVTGVEMFIIGYYNYQQQFNRITRIIEEFCPPVGNTEEKKRRLERIREYEKNNFIPTKRDLALELVLGGVENIQNTLNVFIVSKNLRVYLYRELLGSAYDEIPFPLPWSLRVSSNFSITVDYFKHPPSKEDLLPKLAEFLKEEK
jgi:hypothetical protein